MSPAVGTVGHGRERRHHGVHDGPRSSGRLRLVPPYGEAWGVCDDQADSRGAIAQLKDLTAGVQYGLVDDTGYDNTCARANVLFNITDGHRVALRVCLRNGALGAITSCSAWKYTTA